MKNFSDILKMINETRYMDFVEDFSHIRSILNYCNDYGRPLSKIKHRGGNEIYINEIVTRFQAFFRLKKYINETNRPNCQYDRELRKITFFLILNTEMTLKYDLSEDKTICHLINWKPQLTKFLLFTCIWQLNLGKYLCECIAYSPLWFTVPLIDKTADTLKYLDGNVVSENANKVIQAIFMNIARSDYRTGLKLNLSNLFDNVEHYILYAKVMTEKLEGMKQKRQYLYYGNVMWHILDLTLNVLNIYSEKPPFKLSNEHKIYSLMEHIENNCDNHSRIYSKQAKTMLEESLMVVFNCVQSNLKEVTLSMFIYWVEKDIDDENTLQSSVGNAAFRIIEWMKRNLDLKHDVIDQLNTISVKPKTQEERAKEATLGQIMRKLKKSDLDIDTKQLWLTAFIERGELVLDNEECLDTIEENITFLTMENIQEILLYVAKLTDEDFVDPKLSKCINEALDNFDEKQIQKLISSSIQLNIDDRLELENLDNILTGILNKSTNGIAVKPTLKLIFQNPAECFEKIFNESIKQIQTNHLIEFIQEIGEISHHYLEDNINGFLEKNLVDLPAEEEKHVPIFIYKIYQTKIISDEQLISKILYKPMVEALNAKNFRKIGMLMKIFCYLANRINFERLSAPVLVMAGQVLDQCRWDMLTYTDELDGIVVKTIDCIQDVMRHFLPVAQQKDKSWIFSKIKTFKPITRYYFHKLSLQKDDPVEHFDVFLRNQLPTQRSEIEFLTENFVRCTKKETTWLAKNPELLSHFTTFILLLSAVIAKTKHTNSIDCFRHCVQCYINIVKNVILPQKQHIDEKIALLKELMQVLMKWQEITIYNELFMCMHSVILDIIDQMLPNMKGQAEVMKDYISELADCESKTLTLQKLNVLML